MIIKSFDGTKLLSFLFIFLLIFTTFSSFTGKAKPDNPYGENTWEMEHLAMSLIYRNGSVLETKHRTEIFDHLEVKVVSENEKWARVRVKWEDYVEKKRDYAGYYNDENRTIPDYDHLYFKVEKSTNIAYLEKTDKMLGFFPFYIFHYTNTDITGKDNKKMINADKKYEMSFGKDSDYGDVFFFDCFKKIDFYSNYTTTTFDNKTNRYRRLMEDREIFDLKTKGHYPIRFTLFIPAKFMLNNTENNEEYIRIIGGIEEEEQPEAVQFLKQLDVGPTPYEKMKTNFYIIVAVSVIIVISSISGYLVYKKQGDSKR